MAFEFTETVTIELPDVQLSDFAESDYKKSHGLIVEVAAIHEGLTANYNMYTAEALEESLTSWVTPYPKPIILNHDLTSEPLGRVMAAKMEKESDGTPYTLLQIAVTDPEAVAKIADQRYLTGSVGGKAESASCSICGAEWSEASISNIPCRHSRGKTYKGKLAYLDVRGISFREYSFVNVPADKNSSIRKVAKPTDDPIKTGEQQDDDGWVRAAKVFSINMDEQEILEFSEAEDHDVLDNLTEREASPVYMQIKGAFLSALATASFSEADDDKKKPYGDVKYADPGYQDDNKKRYPLDTKDHVRAAWSYVNQKKNASKYSPEQLKKIKGRIKAAAKKMGISISNEEQAVTNNTMEDEDILAVAEELSSDLEKDSVSEEDLEETDVEEEEASTEDQEDPSDAAAEDSDDEEEAPADAEEAKEAEEKPEGQEKPSGDVDPEDSDGAPVSRETDDEDEDSDPDKGEEPKASTDDSEEEEEAPSAEESDSDTDLNEDKALESRVEELETERDALKDENSKLRALLKRNLAERVVDMKISVGLVSEEDRKAQLEEHTKRSASSLADSIRDLSAMPSRNTTDPTEAPKVTEKTSVTDGDEKVVQEFDDESPSVTPEERFEDVMVERLMGKRHF